MDECNADPDWLATKSHCLFQIDRHVYSLFGKKCGKSESGVEKNFENVGHDIRLFNLKSFDNVWPLRRCWDTHWILLNSFFKLSFIVHPLPFLDTFGKYNKNSCHIVTTKTVWFIGQLIMKNILNYSFEINDLGL